VYEAYEQWSNNFEKPHQLKEAVLYALEARLNEEENARIHEVALVKDVI